MKKETKIILSILLIILIAFSILLIINKKISNNKINFCKNMQNEFIDKLNLIVDKNCSEDSDCIDIKINCGYCINKESDLSEINNLKKNYPNEGCYLMCNDIVKFCKCYNETCV